MEGEEEVGRRRSEKRERGSVVAVVVVVTNSPHSCLGPWASHCCDEASVAAAARCGPPSGRALASRQRQRRSSGSARMPLNGESLSIVVLEL